MSANGEHNMTTAYIVSLAREYLDIIERIAHGLFADGSELYALESERATLHQQLESAVKRNVAKDRMPTYARHLVGEAT